MLSYLSSLTQIQKKSRKMPVARDLITCNLLGSRQISKQLDMSQKQDNILYLINIHFLDYPDFLAWSKGIQIIEVWLYPAAIRWHLYAILPINYMAVEISIPTF